MSAIKRFSPVDSSSVGTAEQVAQRLPSEQCEPPPALMLGPIMDHVASLAPCREVGRGVVGRVVVPVGGGQENSRHARAAEHVHRAGEADLPASSVTPDTALRVPPSSVAEVIYEVTMRPTAGLAPALGALEADHLGELRPVDGIEKAVLAPDRHGGRNSPRMSPP